MTYQVIPDKMRLEHVLTVDYPDKKMHSIYKKGKGKMIPLQARCGPEGG